MKYYVIGDADNTVSVVFHDYVTADFIVRSVSESFRCAFESVVSYNSSYIFNKKDSKLKFNIFGPQFPNWMDKVLDKLCGNHWVIKTSGDITGSAFIDDIVQKFLPCL